MESRQLIGTGIGALVRGHARVGYCLHRRRPRIGDYIGIALGVALGVALGGALARR